jgi:hypothetical protein
VRAIAAAALLLATLSGPALAVCVVDADRTEEQAVREAKFVFVVTITAANLDLPIEELRDKKGYTVRYSYRVAKRLRGDPASIPFLTTGGYYDDPNDGKFFDFAEQGRFVPGDSVLVIANAPGPVPISWIGCTPSRPWSSEAAALVKKVFRNAP